MRLKRVRIRCGRGCCDSTRGASSKAAALRWGKEFPLGLRCGSTMKKNGTTPSGRIRCPTGRAAHAKSVFADSQAAVRIPDVPCGFLGDRADSQLGVRFSISRANPHDLARIHTARPPMPQITDDPFTHHASRKRFGARGLPRTNRKKRPRLPDGDAARFDHPGARIPNRWNSTVSASPARSGTKRRPPSYDHNRQETGVSPGWGRNERRPIRLHNHGSLENGRFWIA